MSKGDEILRMAMGPDYKPLPDLSSGLDGHFLKLLIKHADEVLGDLEEQIGALQAELKQKEAQLSEHEKGIPIEKADKERVYFFVSPAGLIWRVVWSEADQEWLTRSAHDREYEPLRVDHVHPLPTAVKEDT